MDRAGRGAAVPGLALRGHVRRLRWLVRRGRLRQVRDQWQHRGLAVAEHSRRSPRRRTRPGEHPGGRGARRVPLAARLAAPDAGAERRPARGHGISSGPWHRVVTAARLGPPGPNTARAAPTVDDRQPAPGCGGGARRTIFRRSGSVLRPPVADGGPSGVLRRATSSAPPGAGRPCAFRWRPVCRRRPERRRLLGGHGAVAHHERADLPGRRAAVAAAHG